MNFFLPRFWFLSGIRQKFIQSHCFTHPLPLFFFLNRNLCGSVDPSCNLCPLRVPVSVSSPSLLSVLPAFLTDKFRNAAPQELCITFFPLFCLKDCRYIRFIFYPGKSVERWSRRLYQSFKLFFFCIFCSCFFFSRFIIIEDLCFFDFRFFKA